MNILYLHGLQSKLKPEKRKYLEKFGKIFAPDIDYSVAHQQPASILSRYPDTEINVVIGSSMGGLNAYLVSELIGRPTLLFNPSLARYRESQRGFEPKFGRLTSFKQLLLGGSDEVVDARETLEFLGRDLRKHELFLQIDPHLGHRIPMQLFREQVSSFFSRLCY